MITRNLVLDGLLIFGGKMKKNRFICMSLKMEAKLVSSRDVSRTDEAVRHSLSHWYSLSSIQHRNFAINSSSREARTLRIILLSMHLIISAFNPCAA